MDAGDDTGQLERDETAMTADTTKKKKTMEDFPMDTPPERGDSSDVETFNGKIVYNPDGSAYIIEGTDSSELSDDDDNFLPATSNPQLVSALHIARPLFVQRAYNSFNHKVPEIPVMHSYRVFTLKEEEAPSYSVWDCGTVPVKPILMCFICKLSFGFTKSFVGHATGEHSLSLNEAEKELVSRKNISAVIQGASADPLLSFLEPMPPTNAGSVSSSSSTSSDVVQPAQQDTDSVVASVPPSDVTPTSESFNASAAGFGDNSLAPELEDLANIEKMAEAAVAAAAAAIVSVPESSSSKSPLPVANGSHIPNQSHQERMPNSLSPVKNSPSINNHHHPQQSSPTSMDDNAENISPKSAISHNSNKSPSPIAMPTMSLSTCSHHPEGKMNGVECPKCDMILGSSRSLGGHMTMMHSRNSCKTLKCPKCNWHYKYQETLEIHMKEKHPENEMTCLYCVTNQPHPRLARGETYTCGYKPYRCEVCNYSTTTKGNLSIHMQSDKHINNVQELQNGSLTSEHIAALQQQSQQQQQQQQQQAAVSSPAVPSSNPVSSEALKKAQLTPKPKANWRCDVCNYETNVARNLRIHMTSEKHTHNMMVIQQNMKHIHHLSAMQQAQMDPVFQFHPGLLMPADAQLQPEAAIADMAYNHALLMMASQQQQHQQQQQQQQQQHQQQQQQRAMAAAAAAAANAKSHHIAAPLNLSCPPAMDLEHPDPTLRADVPYDDKDKLYQCCVCSIYSSNSLESLSQHVQLDRSRLREDEVLTVVAGTSICKLCTYKTNLKANFQLHCKTDKHLQRLHHVNHVKEGGPKNDWKLKYVNVSNPVQVRCNACDYYTNSLHKMQLHTTNPRHEANARLFLFLERTDITSEFKSYHCTMCNVSVRTKVNLIQHVVSIAHLRTENLRQMQGEGEPDMRDIFVVKEAKQATTETLRNEDKEINNCENGPEGLLAIEDRAKEDSKPPKASDTSMLKQALLDRGSVSENGNSDLHTCPFCNYSSSSEVRIQMHVVSQHSHATLACPLCQEGFREWAPLENHLMETHHVNKEGVKRLLALVDKTEWMAEMQSKQNENKIVKDEAEPKNKVVKDEVEQKNKVVKDEPKAITNGPADLRTTFDKDEPMDLKQEDVDSRSDSSDDEDFLCAVCGRTFVQVEDLFCHQNEMGHLEYKNTPKGNGYFCWKKGCGLYFATMTATQFHFKEMHSLKMNVPVSERHVYKYRCTQCSLAFKTSDKLKIHMQYHLIRAATKCVLCGKSFRTVLALQKHVEMSHPDMTKDQLEQYRASLMNNPLLTSNGGVSILDPQPTELKRETNRDDFEDDVPDEVMSLPDESDAVDETMEEVGEAKEQQVLEDYINSQAIAEDSYSDPNRKYKCHRCKVAFTRQGYLTSHNKTLLHRKGEKMSYPMEKYLDPNRPFKCEVCKESFTQKNILLVHYNSVSHLHKVKLSMKENNAPNTPTISSSGVASPESPTVVTTSSTTVASSNTSSSVTPISQAGNCEDSEKKPYKCNLCKLSYNQASNLDVHVRSVLHQSKASKIQELVLSGELDLSTPLVERPEDLSTSIEQPSTKGPESNASSNSSSKFPTPTTQNAKVSEASQPSTTSIISPVTSSPQFSFPLHPDHNNIMQQALNLMQPSLMHGQAPPFQCNRCGSMCSSHDALMQHQQLYCFFAQTPLLNTAPTTPQAPMLPSQTRQSDEPVAEKQPRLALGTSSEPSPAIQTNHTQRSPTPGQQMHRSRFPFMRPKPLIFRHLLESFGFDVVMQFNENSQRRHKKESEKKDEQKENCSENKESEVNEISEKKAKLDLPEINRSVCDKCGKGFSSIWVLKAHQEETHKEIVPLKNVEKFAEEFREDYERRNAATSVVDDAMAEAPSPSSSGETSAGPSPAAPSAPTLPNAATPPVGSSQMPDVASSVTANHMAAQMQFNQLIMSMGLGMGLPMSMGMNMPFAAAMNMHPPLIPLMMPPPLDPLMASAFGHPMMPGAAVDPNFFAAQQKMLQQQQLSQQQKRARTRINDDQLKILRAYFDINNSPTEDQLLEMSDKSGLPLKVIKHWFRNTLFKERQRNKDSPYNFNNPPSTFLNLEEYEKTGETKITPLASEKVNGQKNSENNQVLEKRETPVTDNEKNNDDFTEICSKDIKVEKFSHNDYQKSEPPIQSKRTESNISYNSCMTSAAQEMMAMSDALNCVVSGTPSTSMLSMDLRTSLSDSFSTSYNNNPFASSLMSFMPPGSVSPPTSESPHSTGTPSGTPTPSCSSSGKRANRTRFTDYQIKVLQEFFETNAYPKDDDLEYLSKLLNLSPRVIVVWFQNARQKARKVYENQPPITPEEENAGRFQRTPGLNYQCKKCLQVFQRYYELIKHQKSSCFKDENPLAGQIKVMSSGDERSSQPPTPTLAIANIPVAPTPPRPTEKVSSPSSNQNGTYRCDKCSLAFSRFDLWREHQMVHMMNPSLFPSYQQSPFPALQYDSPSTPTSALQLTHMKRKLSDDEESQSEHPRDKRLRTTILPEQLDYLYQQYQIESNPSRKMLENIAREVGLKKRVVQVWFQNTRARERKGQFRAHQQVIHKRCPFCRALFKARSALESHLATRHADQYTKGDINIDALPDGEGDSNPEDTECEDKISTSDPNFSSNPADAVNNQMKRYYEDSLRKYFDELVSNSKENSKDATLIAELSLGKAADKASSECSPAKDHPLDLSKPLKALIEKSNGSLAEKFHLEDGMSRCGLMDDARSETYSESTDNMDAEDESNPTSPSSRYSSSSNKRFRTQMTTTQLKVMKSIFVDYKTPSMCECESLGKEIGLPKRVVQVWFQNARAKEKKARLAFLKTFGHEMEPPKVSEECSHCNVKYNLKISPSTLQEHIFSRRHIENMKAHIESLKKLTDGQDSDTDSTTTNCNNNGSSNHSTPKQFVNNLDKAAIKEVYDASAGQRKEAMTNGEVAIKDKEDNFSSQQDHDFVPPTSTDSSTAGMFPYMYSPFSGYYSGMPGAFLHHAMYPGRTKL